jgi:hypothetical protein
MEKKGAGFGPRLCRDPVLRYAVQCLSRNVVTTITIVLYSKMDVVKVARELLTAE